ncbi:MAG: MFS transporter, partial [archaeon]|nr:MFS transporter [archaeon]
MFLILGCVNIIDQFTTAFPNQIQSAIAADFLQSYSIIEQNSILALGSAIFSIGAYFVFFLQYFADRWGRKILLIITTFGTALALIGILLSTNYMMYILLSLFLRFFYSSDIWM